MNKNILKTFFVLIKFDEPDTICINLYCAEPNIYRSVKYELGILFSTVQPSEPDESSAVVVASPHFPQQVSLLCGLPGR